MMLEIDPSIHQLLAFIQHASELSPLASEAPAAAIYLPGPSEHHQLPYADYQSVRRLSSLITWSRADTAVIIHYLPNSTQNNVPDHGLQYYSWSPHGIPTPQSADDSVEPETASPLAFADRDFDEPRPPAQLPALPERGFITDQAWALEPGAAPPPPVAVESVSKRKAHRVSEKARRDRLTGAIRDLEAQLTVGYSPGQDGLLDEAGQLNALSSKADVVEMATRYIKLLRRDRVAGGAKGGRGKKTKKRFPGPETLQLGLPEEAAVDVEWPQSPSMRDDSG
ncbi:hypothetical protein RB598_001501 [Gaeumannomyces tritici]